MVRDFGDYVHDAGESVPPCMRQHFADDMAKFKRGTPQRFQLLCL